MWRSGATRTPRSGLANEQRDTQDRRVHGVGVPQLPVRSVQGRHRMRHIPPTRPSMESGTPMTDFRNMPAAQPARRHRGGMSLLGTSGIPLLLPLAVARKPRCVECGSLRTWSMPGVAPFTGDPMLHRFCDDCGRCTSAMNPKEKT